MTTLSTSKELSMTFTVILDIGAGPNSNCKDVLPTLWLANVQPIRLSTWAAGDTTFKAEWVICLSVNIGRHDAILKFGFAPILKNEKILEMVFLDKKLCRIEANGRQIVLKSGHAVTMVESFDDKGTIIGYQFCRRWWQFEQYKGDESRNMQIVQGHDNSAEKGRTYNGPKSSCSSCRNSRRNNHTAQKGI